jgi:hypothetical protein
MKILPIALTRIPLSWNVQRFTAQQALEHPWFRGVVVDGVVSDDSRATLDTQPSVDLFEVLGELKRFNAFRKFRKGVLAILAANKFRVGMMDREHSTGLSTDLSDLRVSSATNILVSTDDQADYDLE